MKIFHKEFKEKNKIEIKQIGFWSLSAPDIWKMVLLQQIYTTDNWTFLGGI